VLPDDGAGRRPEAAMSFRELTMIDVSRFARDPASFATIAPKRGES
jgi:hypothetical protein